MLSSFRLFFSPLTSSHVSCRFLCFCRTDRQFSMNANTSSICVWDMIVRNILLTRLHQQAPNNILFPQFFFHSPQRVMPLRRQIFRAKRREKKSEGSNVSYEQYERQDSVGIPSEMKQLLYNVTEMLCSLFCFRNKVATRKTYQVRYDRNDERNGWKGRGKKVLLLPLLGSWKKGKGVIVCMWEVILPAASSTQSEPVITN